MSYFRGSRDRIFWGRIELTAAGRTGRIFGKQLNPSLKAALPKFAGRYPAEGLFVAARYRFSGASLSTVLIFAYSCAICSGDIWAITLSVQIASPSSAPRVSPRGCHPAHCSFTAPQLIPLLLWGDSCTSASSTPRCRWNFGFPLSRADCLLHGVSSRGSVISPKYPTSRSLSNVMCGDGL